MKGGSGRGVTIIIFAVVVVMLLNIGVRESGKAKKLEIQNAELRVELKILRKLMEAINIEKLLAEDPLAKEFEALEAKRDSDQG